MLLLCVNKNHFQFSQLLKLQATFFKTCVFFCDKIKLRLFDMDLSMQFWLCIKNAVLEKFLDNIYIFPYWNTYTTKRQQKHKYRCYHSENVEKSSGNNSLVTHGDSRVCCLILSDFEKAAKQAKKGGHHYVVLSSETGCTKNANAKRRADASAHRSKFICIRGKRLFIYMYVCMYVSMYV